ncbi:unnamed protein product [Thelazia callipaeda]|uniref:Aftiphilin clathrin-binding box domain-containing protein n=1 Tax=Thelazia callipaeda TaxID=103827 RepID=A0A0N5D678_THECL|nr:unnamed protein product [Thelazia callipaeda]
MQWHDSSLRSYFLHSLNIDVKQAAIRNSGLPVFAQQLEESRSSYRSIICHRAPPRSVTIDSLAVPPAQFDWNHFGLTNPLKTECAVSSALLDLDFLASTSTSGTTSSGELIKVLNCLLKNSDKERKYTPVSELSLDARALHDQLPDLDYMLSNVLLFPVINR